MIKVAIYEDNQSLRLGLYHLVNGTEGYTCVGAFQDCAHLMQNIRDTAPDVVLMDIGMPGLSGIEAVRILRKEYPLLKILMQTIFEDTDKIFESILAGASGYILKNTSPSRILDYIKETYEGGAPMSPSVAVKVLKMVGQPVSKEAIDKFNLTEREKEILACLIKGMSYRMIAESCFISVDTVRGHIRSIYEKLHVHSKGEAVAKAIKGNIL
ncbi:MAG TPA: response regulator transcription factor [Saprospiraceae bacterium]|nr:response regulator transcription factor [Saprospiraceae bacterium]